MIVENYGLPIIDLGRDVKADVVLDALRKSGARMLGLSALMTTTVRSMEHTIKLVHEQLPYVKVMVGGAVLNPEYAKKIGADYYAKDAAESARIANEYFEGLAIRT
ncbi:MAG: cobalamin-dependent protein [Eggerthellaceae bacterium]|nr:cobalamin-dependent protein [Eggerthellaceae bacterium]